MGGCWAFGQFGDWDVNNVKAGGKSDARNEVRCGRLTRVFAISQGQPRHVVEEGSDSGASHLQYGRRSAESNFLKAQARPAGVAGGEMERTMDSSLPQMGARTAGQ